MSKDAELAKFRRARFEKRVMMIFEKSYDNMERNVLVKGKKSKRPYKVDLHAWKFKGLLKNIRFDIWVKLSKKRVDKDTIKHFYKSVEDVREAKKAGIGDWSPDHVFIASNVGFDSEALKLAKEYDVFCMNIDKDGFDFVGEVKPVGWLSLFFRQIFYFIISTIAIIAIIYIIKLLFL